LSVHNFYLYVLAKLGTVLMVKLNLILFINQNQQMHMHFVPKLTTYG
jgi:hypothetical protein